jgi:hypothetical protein
LDAEDKTMKKLTMLAILAGTLFTAVPVMAGDDCCCPKCDCCKTECCCCDC